MQTLVSAENFNGIKPEFIPIKRDKPSLVISFIMPIFSFSFAKHSSIRIHVFKGIHASYDSMAKRFVPHYTFPCHFKGDHRQGAGIAYLLTATVTMRFLIVLLIGAATAKFSKKLD